MIKVILMRKIIFISFILLILVCFYLNILALLKLMSIFITAPLLFLSLTIFFTYLNNRNRFRGFH